MDIDFTGHELYKIDDVWLFDITTFVGYKLSFKRKQIQAYEKVFTVRRNKDYGVYIFDRYADIPNRVIRQTEKIIQEYLSGAFLNG